MPLKIAFIGAGSLTFTRTLVRDLLTVPEFRDTRFAFTDINRPYLELSASICRAMIEANGLPAVIETTLDRRRAVADADYVVSAVRVGGLEAFRSDIEIPLRYGVDQCVGDTLCAGGILYGQRNIACILDFCKDIREVAKPGALFLNYANPNAMNTWAANHFGKVPTLGLCHGVQGGHAQIANVIQLLVNGDRKPGDRGFVPVTRHDVDIVCAGINHQTWYIRILYRGKDWTGRMLEGFRRHPVYSRTEKVRIDMLERFGYYSTESNGHLSEYVAWYRKRPADIGKWIDLSSWIHGETGGYLRTCIESRSTSMRDARRLRETAAAERLAPESRSVEHGSHIIEARETGRVYRGHFNVVNRGCLTNLPDDAIVEVPAYVDRNGVNVPRIGELPMGCAAVCNASIAVQRLAVHAAVAGDVALLKQALLLDPLTGAVCDPVEISQMADEMLTAQARWLPQYRKAIPAARARIAAAKRAGTYRGTNRSRGAARLEVGKGANGWAVQAGARILTTYRASDLLPCPGGVRRLKPVSIAALKRPLRTITLGSDGFADIRPIHQGRDGVVFLAASFRAAKARPGLLVYGADGPVRAWVNGREADCRPDATNPCVPGQYEAKTSWRKGENQILFALASNRGQAWGLVAAAAAPR
jgi:alpha-galactosidase